jgi:hypothetical protein
MEQARRHVLSCGAAPFPSTLSGDSLLLELQAQCLAVVGTYSSCTFLQLHQQVLDCRPLCGLTLPGMYLPTSILFVHARRTFLRASAFRFIQPSRTSRKTNRSLP